MMEFTDVNLAEIVSGDFARGVLRGGCLQREGTGDKKGFLFFGHAFDVGFEVFETEEVFLVAWVGGEDCIADSEDAASEGQELACVDYPGGDIDILYDLVDTD